jgi:DNA modification methylase
MTQTPNDNDIKLENAFVMYGDSIKRLKELPDNSVDSIVTDPPYGLSDNKYVADTIAKWINGERDFIPDGKGFMGKAWDSFVPPPAIWDECLRVLKPGGHLLAFFGSRTQDIGALSIRLAGFEIRDSISWVYGSGFPKSMDISKAIDKNNGETDRLQRFTAFMRTTGLTAKQLNDCTNSNMGSHYITDKSQPAIPTASYWKLIRSLITIEIPEWVDKLVDRIEAEREVIDSKPAYGIGNNGAAFNGHKEGAMAITSLPATDAAKKYEGWGTALKPAHEPIMVARKPLSESTVANNVLQWGTGGLNIDASRIGFTSEADYKESTQKNQHADFGTAPMEGNNTYGDWSMIQPKNYKPTGRFPANFILSHTEDCEETGETRSVKTGTAVNRNRPEDGSPRENPANYAIIMRKGEDQTYGSNGEEALPVFRCAEGCPVAELDKQSGVLTSGGGNKSNKQPKSIMSQVPANPNAGKFTVDKGGASRFFYVAKASKKDRNEGMTEANNIHPTVKPTQLMEYLIKLVTPEGGTVLDPFTGSGSTGKAALLNGFKFIGCELTEEYLPIIEGRLSWASANKDKYQADKIAAVTKANKVAQNTRSKATGGSLTALDAAEVALQQIAAKKANKADNQLPLFDEVEE